VSIGPPPDLEQAPNLLTAARSGSREALGQVLEFYRQDLLELAQRELHPELRGKGGASDLVQETFLKAQRGFGEFHGTTPAELHAWLRAILRNHLANFSRCYRGTDKRQLGREVVLDEQRLKSSAGSPSSAAMRREHAELLEKALEHLPDHYLQVILLRHRENLSFEEIGQTMSRSAEAARKLWERAIALLRDQLPLPDED
jgi:RNA polymerase sigma-70 factor (ECF subfamily)